MKITADNRGEILDLTIKAGTRLGGLMAADVLAIQYFGPEAEVKRYVCSVTPQTIDYGQRVTLWSMHIYYRTNGNCESPFKTEERLSDD